MSDAVDALIAREGLPDAYRAEVDRWWRPLAEIVAGRHRSAGHPLLVGINGPQGSGKSTLCHFLEVLLAEEHGLSVATLSLDDLYYSKAERQQLSERVHPLFVTRGVPGTHEVFLGQQAIAAALAGKPAMLPRFDKAADDRVPDEGWRPVPGPVDVLLFEGWCVGARPQDEAALAEPVNRLEAEEDADGRWRGWVNEWLSTSYTALFGPISLLVMLNPPGFEQVREWRLLQETKLAARTGRGMTETELERFVQHYERLTRHMLETLPGVADIVVGIDADHRVTGLSGPACPAPPAAS